MIIVCTHPDTEGKQREAGVWNICMLKSSKKNTIFNEHAVHPTIGPTEDWSPASRPLLHNTAAPRNLSLL